MNGDECFLVKSVILIDLKIYATDVHFIKLRSNKEQQKIKLLIQL